MDTGVLIFVKKSTVKIKWFDVADWGVEGKGWSETAHYFSRLPSKAKGKVPDPIWEMSRHATGMSVRFETNATEIHARWTLELEQLNEPRMARTAFSGVDLYARDGKTWRWTGVGENFGNRTPEVCMLDGILPKRRDYLLYLPLRNPVLQLEIGIPEKAFFKPTPPRKSKPIVYYGSSIVHGAYASRAGQVFTSILGRRLDVPLINLGFSGQAKMDLSMAELLAELKARFYVIDALPNMDASLVHERAEKFFTYLCAARSTTPVLLIEDPAQTQAWIKPDMAKVHADKWKAIEKVCDALKKRGVRNFHFIKGRNLIGEDNDGCVDGIHPNDAGYMRMADHLYPILKKFSAVK